MKHYLFKIGVIWMVTLRLGMADQPTDADLRQMVTDISIDKAGEGIALALKEDKPEILVYAMKHPKWTVKTKALEAIGKLTPREAAKAFTAILNQNELWTRSMSGRKAAVQNDFAETLKNEIYTACSTDIKTYDLFNDKDRAKAAKFLEKFN